MIKIPVDVKRLSLFPIPLFKIKLELDRSIAISKLYEIKSNDKGRVISNVGGWQSHDNLLEYEEFNFINIFTSQFTKNVLQSSFYNLQNLWGNISSTNCYNEPHDHSMKFENKQQCWSGVFYLQVPKNSGNLKFHNPSSISDISSFETSTGEFMIFPAHIPHSVGINYASEDRISLAFNFTTDLNYLDSAKIWIQN